jgi:hypothetical protein
VIEFFESVAKHSELTIVVDESIAFAQSVELLDRSLKQLSNQNKQRTDQKKTNEEAEMKLYPRTEWIEV